MCPFLPDQLRAGVTRVAGAGCARRRTPAPTPGAVIGPLEEQAVIDARAPGRDGVGRRTRSTAC